MNPPPYPTASPISTANNIPLHRQPLGHSEGIFKGIVIEAPHPFPPTLFKPSLSAMSYDNNIFLNDVMATVLRNISSRQVSLLYKVPYRSIMNFTTALEYIQEQRVTPLVENRNQQQIYRWVRNHLLLPSGRGHYTDWELCQ